MNQFQTDSIYNGFFLDRQEYIPEIQSTVFLFTHTVLGCQAVAIKNTDPNKTFCVSFMTVPKDSTGVAHILEHSVLMGSQKYPVRDVFGEINKGGLMTFLNAMTGADTTWYPFATRNIKEYFNIMDVYCDVVFHPLLLRSTFEQEGWHYHLETPDAQPQFMGVVFNEMKGVWSDPIRSLFHYTFRNLLPGSTYAHESGGDPRHIPDLDYEQFVDFHKSHYHPSNSTFFFYGDAPLEDELRFIQDKFLSKFPQPVAKARIEEGQLIEQPLFVNEYYPIHPDSPVKERTFLSITSAVGKVTDRKLNIAFHIIANILFNSDGSPLKKAIINASLCRDFGGLFLADASHQGIMTTYLVGSDAEKRDHFLALYKATLGRMAGSSLDRDLVLSELNRYEFSLREECNKAQRGLDLIGKALPAMKHDLLPFDTLQIEKLLAEVRKEAIEDGYFEHLIRTRLLDNPATVTLTLAPDAAKMLKNQQEEEERLTRFAQSLDQNAKKQLAAHTQELMALQMSRNSDETLRRLPMLHLDDLERQPAFYESCESEVNGRLLLVNELPTNGICYLDFGLDCSGLSADLLLHLDIFATILTEIGTKKRDYMQFAKDVNLCTGGFSTSFQIYTPKDKPMRPILWLHMKTLSSYLEEALDLLAEVLSLLDLADVEHIEEIVQREYAWVDHSAQSEGYSLAAARVYAQLSLAGQYKEAVQGMSAFFNLKKLAHNYPEKEQEFLDTLARIREKLFNRQSLLMSITAGAEDISRFRALAPRVIDALPDRPVQKENPVFAELPTAQAFITPAEVVYNIQACRLFPNPQQYNGTFEVLRTWISRDYLWNTVRQMGGAYGCFIQFNHLSGNLGLVSYRDPQVHKTYAAYQALPGVIAGLDLSPDTLQQLIIGAYGALTPHQGPASIGASARNDFLSGLGAQFKQQRVTEVLDTKLTDLRGFAENFAALNQTRHLASIGNKEKIEQDKALFAAITML